MGKAGVEFYKLKLWDLQCNLLIFIITHPLAFLENLLVCCKILESVFFFFPCSSLLIVVGIML